MHVSTRRRVARVKAPARPGAHRGSSGRTTVRRLPISGSQPLASIARGELAEEERRTRLEAISASLNAVEVATQLGVDVAQVDHRQAEGSLYAFTADGERRYPTWQFTGDPRQPILPGLARLVTAFPLDRHPAGIRGFMSTPQSSALIDGVPMTPVDWLLHGGDPQVIRNILDSFLMS